MADEQYSWLNRETAERLLRGESLDAVDADAREQAERLAEALGALSATPAPTSDELPGEAAALAAFRSARAERPALRGAAARTGSSDAGLVRLSGAAGAARHPRWARPLRYGLAAALAAGMVGGVAVAAGTGVLPTPFDDAEPAPAASVSAVATPRHPLTTPSPDATGGAPSPDGFVGTGDAGRDIAGGSAGSRGSGGSGTLRRDGSTPRPDTGRDTGPTRSETTASCRLLRDGRTLDADRKRALEGAAGGSARVWTYCKGLLAEADSRGRGDGVLDTLPDTGGLGEGGSGQDDKGDTDDKDEPGDGGNGGGDGGGSGTGRDNRDRDRDRVGGGQGGRDRDGGDTHRRRERTAGLPPVFSPALPAQPSAPAPEQSGEPSRPSPDPSRPSPSPADSAL
ncbi:hypothetical protein [Streptomyces sp. enrichment culture]|uniref:hypothetical protein n=1 Tax=Streptomyces sp. enrichment culture TaxID=1795815 RepID=UPI003F579A98